MCKCLFCMVPRFLQTVNLTVIVNVTCQCVMRHRLLPLRGTGSLRGFLPRSIPVNRVTSPPRAYLWTLPGPRNPGVATTLARTFIDCH